MFLAFEILITRIEICGWYLFFLQLLFWIFQPADRGEWVQTRVRCHFSNCKSFKQTEINDLKSKRKSTQIWMRWCENRRALAGWAHRTHKYSHFQCIYLKRWWFLIWTPRKLFHKCIVAISAKQAENRCKRKRAIMSAKHHNFAHSPKSNSVQLIMAVKTNLYFQQNLLEMVDPFLFALD